MTDAKEAEATDKPVWKIFVAKSWWIVLTAVLGVAGGYWLSHYENRTRYFDYEIRSNDAIVSTPSALPHKIAVQVDDKPIESVSQVAVSLYNFSDRDFDDVQIHIDLASPDGSPLSVLTSSSVNAHGDPVVEIHDLLLKEGELPPKQNFKYMLKIANRVENQPVFKADFLIPGKKIPLVTIHVENKGLDSRPYVVAGPFWRSSAPTWLIALVACMMVANIVYYLVYFAPRLRQVRGELVVSERRSARNDELIKELDGKIGTIRGEIQRATGEMRGINADK